MVVSALAALQGDSGIALGNAYGSGRIGLEEGVGIALSRDCTNRLRRYLPGYDKKISSHQITDERISNALRRAKLRDVPPCADWPRALDGTTVYRLVENILRERGGGD